MRCCQQTFSVQARQRERSHQLIFCSPKHDYGEVTHHPPIFQLTSPMFLRFPPTWNVICPLKCMQLVSTSIKLHSFRVIKLQSSMKVLKFCMDSHIPKATNSGEKHITENIIWFEFETKYVAAHSTIFGFQLTPDSTS